MFLDYNGKLTINAQYYEDYKGVVNSRYPKRAGDNKNITFPLALDLGGGILMHKGRGIIFNDIRPEFENDPDPPNAMVPPQSLYYHSRINPGTGSIQNGQGGFAYRDNVGITRIIAAQTALGDEDTANMVREVGNLNRKAILTTLTGTANLSLIHI